MATETAPRPRSSASWDIANDPQTRSRWHKTRLGLLTILVGSLLLAGAMIVGIVGGLLVEPDLMNAANLQTLSLVNLDSGPAAMSAALLAFLAVILVGFALCAAVPRDGRLHQSIFAAVALVGVWLVLALVRIAIDGPKWMETLGAIAQFVALGLFLLFLRGIGQRFRARVLTRNAGLLVAAYLATLMVIVRFGQLAPFGIVSPPQYEAPREAGQILGGIVVAVVGIAFSVWVLVETKRAHGILKHANA